MERVMSVEERIKRAEEIYSRRNGQYINTSKNLKNKKTSSVKKMIMQIFTCLIVYLAFYIFTNSNYIFSQEFLNQIKTSFSHDSKIYEVYLNTKSYIQQKITSKSGNNMETIEENSIETSEEKEENDSYKKINNNEKETSKKEIKKESKMETDAKLIKKQISFIMPVKGKISSRFGWREPSTSKVPKYHTGIDIAAKKGTIIRSATNGKIIQVSNKGDYGKHYKIKTKDLTIIYAHCNKLYLKKNDKVKQGEKIAEVGTTGNSTGPHLHFEIRKGKELIDPQLILNV